MADPVATVTLVHGTFARSAALDAARLSDAKGVADVAVGPVSFSVFEWSGETHIRPA